jgi:hypothetical protein
VAFVLSAESRNTLEREALGRSRLRWTIVTRRIACAVFSVIRATSDWRLWKIVFGWITLWRIWRIGAVSCAPSLDFGLALRLFDPLLD